MNRSNRRVLLAGLLMVGMAASVTWSAGEREDKPAKPRLVTLHGTVVDIYSHMMGLAPRDQRAAGEHARMVKESIKNGVPACLVTEDGLIILGKGVKAPLELILPMSYLEVEVRGRLFEKDGVQYVDLLAIKALKKEVAEEEEESDEEATEEEGEEEP